jgi:hypothetical protein
MQRIDRLWVAALAGAGLLAPGAARAFSGDEALGFERTPPRLGSIDGEVSFLREDAEDWTPARVNTPLAAGDQLYTGEDANLELQIGARSFVRAGEETRLGLASLEPDFLQLRVTEGRVSLDLRSRKPSQSFEIATPHAAFAIEQIGYYRVEVDGETTTFTSRRGGRATLATADGEVAAIAASEQVVVAGGEVETYAAPELDAWDRWNYARSDGHVDAVSARYVPSGVYGLDDLDQHGDWRLVPTYGAVWVPRRVAVDWVPYSTGRWIYDPFYGWTWVDDAPWGWAPYHYGRWVRVSGYWGWCPGPIVTRPYYAPALVAFYGGGGFSLGFAVGTPRLAWVALGWGEPLVPWWGPAGVRGHAHWAGWGGPRVVNDVVVTHQTVIDVRQIRIHQNAHVHHAVVSVDRDHFGRHPGARGEPRFARAKAEKLAFLHGELPVRPDRTSLVAGRGPTRRPPREVEARSVVATREPRADRVREVAEEDRPRAVRGRERDPEARPAPRPETQIVEPPREDRRIDVSRRPAFGRRGEDERRIAPPAPRYRELEREEASAARAEPARREPARRREARPEPTLREARPEPTVREAPRAQRPERAPSPSVRRAATPSRHRETSPAPPQLPGEPANRVFRPRAERSPVASERAPRGQTPARHEQVQAPRPPEAAAPESGDARSGRGERRRTR